MKGVILLNIVCVNKTNTNIKYSFEKVRYTL